MEHLGQNMQYRHTIQGQYFFQFSHINTGSVCGFEISPTPCYGPCTALQPLHCTTLHWALLPCTALDCTALQPLHCTTLICTALQGPALLFTTQHCTSMTGTVLHCLVLYCNTAQCNAESKCSVFSISPSQLLTPLSCGIIASALSASNTPFIRHWSAIHS